MSGAEAKGLEFKERGANLECTGRGVKWVKINVLSCSEATLYVAHPMHLHGMVLS